MSGPAHRALVFALGVERAISLMDTSVVDSSFCNMGSEDVAFALPVIHKLRACGIRVDTDYTGSSLKSQMKKADKSHAGHTLIIGEQELKNGKAILRNMHTKEQSELTFATLIEDLRTIVMRLVYYPIRMCLLLCCRCLRWSPDF